MKAKDTVMNPEQIKETWHNWKTPLSEGTTFDQWLCLAQAEITWDLAFRAGKQEGWKLFEPTPDKGRLLTDEEQDACSPTGKQVATYLIEPDDMVATKLRQELSPETFRVIAKCILYGKNIAKAQRDLTASILKAQEQARVERLLGDIAVGGER